MEVLSQRSELGPASPPGLPSLGPAPSKPQRRHSGRRAPSTGNGAAVALTAAAVAAASKSAAAGGVPSKWVWGQDPVKVPAVDRGFAQASIVNKQQERLQEQPPREQPQQQKGAEGPGALSAMNVVDHDKTLNMKDMFAAAPSESFESTCR